MREVGSLASLYHLCSHPYLWCRLTSQVSHLEQELQHSRSSAKSRERELLKEIDALKLLLHQRSPVGVIVRTRETLELTGLPESLSCTRRSAFG